LQQVWRLSITEVNMLIKTPSDIPSSEITPESVYLDRRKFMAASTTLMLAATAQSRADTVSAGKILAYSKVKNPAFTTTEVLTPEEDATHYNNYYEFGLDKEDPANYAQKLKTEPWKVVVEGEVGKPGAYALEDIMNPFSLEERIYRLRCVEAWSMVIPWVGFPLGDFLKRLEPTSKAKFVYFETLHDPAQMPGQRSAFSAIEWPYREGLRIDEAMHPLAILAVGMYGKVLPSQNGAPLRLVVPWKYGFKSAKAIVKIRLQETQPETTWELSAPREYGFYANVNPQVDHPRWTQKFERRLPSASLFKPNRIETRMFNGYADQVAHLYDGMDLHRYF
jgi:sulfoxide reductase catalytic subunit YedY